MLAADIIYILGSQVSALRSLARVFRYRYRPRANSDPEPEHPNLKTRTRLPAAETRDLKMHPEPTLRSPVSH
jgi:hypothetical protein